MPNLITGFSRTRRPTAEVATDPIRQLQHVFDITDNQVRSLRRRDLIARYKAAQTKNLQPNAVDPDARFGTYWGIDTDPRKVDAPNALACDPDLVHGLAHVGTRLSDLGDSLSKQIINWGYVVCDRSVRANYTGPLNASAAQLPYPEAKITQP